MARLSGSMWKSGDYKIHNGTVDDIPFGWELATELCDRAIVGAGNSYDHKQTFGNDSVRPAKPSVSVSKPSVSVSVHNHTLSTARIPAHKHYQNGITGYATQGQSHGSGKIQRTSGTYSGIKTVDTEILNAGSSQAHNHGASATVGNISATVGNVGTVDTRQKSIALIWIRKL